MSAFVLDNSITAAWFFEDQGTPYADDVLRAIVAGADVFVPAVWRLEVVNVLVVAERRKKAVPEKVSRFIRSLEQLSVNVDVEGLDRTFTSVLECARFYRRSAYDASYLELAQRLGLPFATRDEPLKQAAAEIGIPVFQP